MAPESNARARIVRFGTFEADLNACELRKGGAKIKVHGQPFEVLVLLLGRPGEIVPREELRQRLWPTDTFVDFDHGVNTAINRLREALGVAVIASSPRSKRRTQRTPDRPSLPQELRLLNQSRLARRLPRAVMEDVQNSWLPPWLSQSRCL
jgi:hypothetical protein